MCSGPDLVRIRRPRRGRAVSQVGPAARFATELQALYEAAGCPPHRQLIHQAGRQQPPIQLNAKSLSDWFGGISVPSSDDKVLFLVQYLQATAADRYPAKPLQWWKQLRAAAWQTKQSSRVGRPRTRSASAASAAGNAGGLGRPISEYTALDLEVHRAITIDGQDALPALPPYVPRAHDGKLARVVAAVAAGHSSCAMLVGGSSTGKTRACWEAIQALPEPWRLWHPYDPTRPQAAEAALDQVGPYTVIWLNEAQHYLLTTDPTLGERIAAGLRRVLRDPGRAPVLILGTMWNEYWTTLTTRPDPGAADPHAQARDLLESVDIAVPREFTATDLATLQHLATDDPRLRCAAEHADQGRITQQLAGVPELVRRYRTATATAKALIEAAMDARRLGHPIPIAHHFLEQAGAGYLSDHEWQQTGDDWLEQALAETAKPCHGVPGPLTRIRPRPGEPSATGRPHYRLADYLEQLGRTERAAIFPPAAFWDAAVTLTDPTALTALGGQARARGRYRRAAQLYRQAADQGSTDALMSLADLREQAGDPSGAEQLYRQAADHGNTHALARLVWSRERSGDLSGAEQLYRQAADQGSTKALVSLAHLRERSGDPSGAEDFAQQAADQGTTNALMSLAHLRERSGDPSGAEQLYRQAADHGNIHALMNIARLREQAGDPSSAEQLYRQAADHGNTHALVSLAEMREQAGDPSGAEDLAQQAADQGNTNALVSLADLREQAGDPSSAEQLYRQAAEHGNTNALVRLAEMREQAGDPSGAEDLAQQAANHGKTDALVSLVWSREYAGDPSSAEDLAQQAAEYGNTNALMNLAHLREQASDPSSAEQLYRQAAEHGNTNALVRLAEMREQAGDPSSAEQLYRQAAEHGNTNALVRLAEMREQAG
ncbi:tetratricopeptide repeat protein, partial [Actinoplanes sp. NPDC049681]|uniref:tetratricopeptide repeat protein n=1 Tax=Actinoplanes sp. NPDC049681 TaxID=3363905 RepID=UPI0037A9B4C8